MKKEVEEALEAINIHAMWMAGRPHEMTQEDQIKEVMLWGGTNREERGERLLDYINTINEWAQSEINPLDEE